MRVDAAPSAGVRSPSDRSVVGAIKEKVGGLAHTEVGLPWGSRASTCQEKGPFAGFSADVGVNEVA